jgi:hypothetical protein
MPVLEASITGQTGTGPPKERSTAPAYLVKIRKLAPNLLRIYCLKLLDAVGCEQKASAEVNANQSLGND